MDTWLIPGAGRTGQAGGRLAGPILGVVVGVAVAGGVLGCRSDAGESDSVHQVATPEEFDRRVLQAGGPVLVDFYATWCPPCKQLAPTIAAIAEEYRGRADVVKVNAEKLADLANTYGVAGYPTVIVFNRGNAVAKLVGLRKADAYRRALDAALAAKHEHHRSPT